MNSPSTSSSPNRSLTDLDLVTTTLSFNDLPPLPTAYDEGTFHHERDIACRVDDFTAVHDQLPSVEAYKSNNNVSGFEATRLTHRRKLLVIIAASIVFVTTCISLGIVVGRDEVAYEEVGAYGGGDSISNDPVDEEEFVDKIDPYEYPTQSPITTNQRNPNATLVYGRVPSRFDTVSAFVSTSGWSELEATLESESPQYKAALWIADFDPLYIEIEDTEKFRNRYVLAVMYYAFGGARWTYDLNWMTIHDVCLWNDDWEDVYGGTVRVGVVCKTGTSMIQSIFLPSNNLVGTIPPEIGLLFKLEDLDLYSNDLLGVLPSTMSKLPLTNLILHDNLFSGTVPAWLSDMLTLETIDLASNVFHGALPNFQSLSSLTSLNLENNRFYGTLDPLQNLKYLQYLRLGHNNISGSLSYDVLFGLENIQELDISQNNLTGSIPELLFQKNLVRVIDLHDNNLDGKLLFDGVSSMTNLEFLSLSQNRLTGSIGSTISNLVGLRHLDLSWNLFTGTMPTEIEYLSLLKYLFLAFNPKFTEGLIPKEWDSLSELVDLSLQGTQRIGPIPGELGLLSNLVMLDLAGNQLSGAIPSDLGNLSELTFLLLKDNKLSGDIPDSFDNLSKLSKIVIDNNDLSGGAGNLCYTGAVALFISDCDEIGCDSSCCTTCCIDEDESCNNALWFSPLDPVAGYRYQRVGYKFNEQDLVFPVAGAAQQVYEHYNTFGVPGGSN